METLTKEVPFVEVTDPEELKAKISGGETPNFSEYLSPYLIELFRECMKLDPSKRKIPSDLIQEDFISTIFRRTFEFTRKNWPSFWDQLSDERKKIPWDEFIVSFCVMFGIRIDKSIIDYNCIKYAFTSLSKSGSVTKEDFLSAIYWITDAVFPGWGFLKSIANNVQHNWYYIHATTQDEGKYIQMKHQFLVRYSRKIDSLTIAFKKKNKKKKPSISHVKK